jgi:hypothetical protein
MLEAPGLVAGFHDVAVMGDSIEQRGGHLRVVEDLWPFGAQSSGGYDTAETARPAPIRPRRPVLPSRSSSRTGRLPRGRTPEG